MRRPVLVSGLLAWLALAVLAIANGGFREAVLVPWLGSDGAHVPSTVLLCLVILAVAWVYRSRLPVRPERGELVAVGALWTALTLAFEFGFFVGVMGEPVAVVLAAYDVSSGQVWVLVPLTTLVAPVVVDALRRRRAG